MRRALISGLALAAAALPALLPAAEAKPAYPTAVKKALQQTFIAKPYTGYKPGKNVQQNVEARLKGTPLTLQATYIGRNAAEPTIGVDAQGRAFMTASAFDSVVAVNTPVASTRTPRTEVRRSTDGGRTWKNVLPEVPVVQTMPPTTLDPMLWLDKKTGRVFSVELTLAGSYLQWSDDGGETWTPGPLCCGNPVDDHQTFAGGPPTALGPPPVGYPNVLYYCFNRVADASCSRSLDGGLTWTATGAPAFHGACPEGGGHANVGPVSASSAIAGHLVVDAKGTVYLPAGHCGMPYLAISTDQGATWTFRQISEVYGTSPDAGLGQNHLAVAVDAAGTVYFVWWTRDTLPLLSYSKDGGMTWSRPVMIAPPGVRSVNFPIIAAGRAGQVAIVFPGAPRRWDYSAKGEHDYRLPWNTYVLTSLNANTRQPAFYSSTVNPVNDPVHRGPCQGRCGGMYDFLDVKYAPNGEIWASVVDNCTLKRVNDKLRACANGGDESKSTANDGQGIAIRQLAGPGLSR